MWSFAWRAGLVLLLVGGATAGMGSLTEDQGLVIIGVLFVAVPALGALWPVELGLKPPPERPRVDDEPRDDAAPDH
ncbi:MAG TPA: hypothetical protein VF529_04520 [Solirubrobacteraceae bacterium]|jgi:hypothetical protein